MSGLQFLVFCAAVLGVAIGLVVLFHHMDGKP